MSEGYEVPTELPGSTGLLYKNISSAVLLYYFVEPFFPPDFGLYKCKKSSVHGTISSVVVSQTIISSVILLYYSVDPFSPPRLMSVQV